MRATGWRWRVCLALAGALFCYGAFAAQAPQARAFSVTASFPFSPTNGGIFLPVTVSGKEFLFLLDTGASRMVYDQTFRDLLGLALKRERVIGTTREGRTNDVFKAPVAFLGKISLQTPEPVLMQDLADFRLLSRLPVYGIIGMSALGRHFVCLDFDENAVKFMSPQDPVTSPQNEGGPQVPKLVATLPTGPERFLLDSGCENFGGLAPGLFDQLVRAGKLRVFGTNVVASFDQPQLMTKGRLDHITTLGQNYRDVVFERSEPNRLGWAFMTNYNWFLDMSHLSVSPEPRAHLYRRRETGK